MAQLDETPKFKAYCQTVMTEFTYLKRRGQTSPF